MDSPKTPTPRLRFGLLIWLASLVGAVVITVTILPQFSAEMPLPAPLWLITLAGVPPERAAPGARHVGGRGAHADRGVPRSTV